MRFGPILMVPVGSAGVPLTGSVRRPRGEPVLDSRPDPSVRVGPVGM